MLRPAADEDGSDVNVGAASELDAGPAAPAAPASTAATRKRERRRALAVYLGSNAAVITMLLLIPDNSVMKRRPDSLVSFWAAVGCSVALFLSVNGSDPGYLNRETAEALAVRQRRAAADRGAGNGQPVEGLEMMERGTREEEEHGTGAGDDDARMLLEDGRQEEQQRHVMAGGRIGDRREAGRAEGYCKWCDMAKPVRAHHCRVCGLCVSRFDHHCGCLGVCIGERNHCRFWWFILAQNAACLAAIDVVSAAYDLHYRSLVDFAMANLLYLSMSLLLWGMEAFAFILLATHTFFALANLTSYECAKGPERVWYLRGVTRDVCDLPFSAGWVSNLQSFCCLIDGAWAALVGGRWRPRDWARQRQPIVRDSGDVCEHPWRNRYWQCC